MIKEVTAIIIFITMLNLICAETNITEPSVLVVQSYNPSIKNNVNYTIDYDKEWSKNSEVKVELSFYKNNTLFYPDNVLFNYNYEGITLKEIKKDNGRINAVFYISPLTKTGLTTINAIVDNQNYPMEVSIVGEKIISTDNKINLWIGGIGLFLLFTILITLALIKDKQND